MAEPDDHLFHLEPTTDVRFGFVRRVVPVLHFERKFVGAAVLRSAQRADGAGERGIQIGAGAGDYARCKRRRIEFVLGV